MFVLEEEDDEDTKKKAPSPGLEDQIEKALLKERKIFFADPVDGNSAKDAIRRLWLLEHKDPGKPILLVISSPGGSVDAGMAICDQVQMISSPVVTLVTGLAASMGSILSLCAAKGKRFATPHSRIMIHQPAIHGVVRGQATDLDIQAQEILKTRHMLVQIYVDSTGKSAAEIEKHLNRDTWMSAEEALAFGLLDKVISSNDELMKEVQSAKK